MARIVLLTEGSSNPDSGKTASSVLRYRGDEVIGIVDSEQNGRTAQELFGVGGPLAIRSDLSDFDGDELMIGVAPVGLNIPASWRQIILDAIERGMNVTSGIHVMLSEDAEIAAAARRKGIRLWDVRRPPDHIGCSDDLAKGAKPIRIHSVGTDCSVGKMTVTIEIDRALQARGLNSRFLATGQSGIMVSGYGLPIDRFVADFIAGGAETLVMENLDRDYLLIEGQGSLYHPLFSGVTLGLLHGCAPDFLILCYTPTRKFLVHTDHPIAAVEDAIDVYESAARLIHPCKIIGLGLNSAGMSDEEAASEIERAESATGLPATDVIRFGAQKLADAIVAAPRPCEGAGSTSNR